jgi:lipid II:glycine glycyltransferase (peptidoglycan interpeptide bridge formation enzyme)
VADRLAERGWHRLDDSAQPRYAVRMPLTGRSLGDVWDGLDPSWRRNIAKAKRAGVETSEGRAEDLDEFYRLLEITQRRGGFDLGRRLPYYRHQFQTMNAEQAGRLRLLLARHDGELLSAHTMATVGARTWYLNGANADRERSLRASNALQWSMIERAHAAGAATYDLRGVKDSLDPDGPHYGLLRWKLGTGGYVAETVGDWEIVLNRPLHQAYRAYLAHRR